jgi:putative endonuclease
MANLLGRRPVLYTGVTNDIERRVAEHRQQCQPPTGFTRRYNITTLVYLEATTDVQAAIAREKQIKGWTRGKKLALIKRQNPAWCDLSSHDRRAPFGAGVFRVKVILIRRGQVDGPRDDRRASSR